MFVRENEAKRIDFSESSLYDITELQAAAALVTEQFAGFEGCTMTSLRYAGDDACSEENLRWMNSLKDGRHFTQCAEFLSDFVSDGTNPVLEKQGNTWTTSGGWPARTAATGNSLPGDTNCSVKD